MKKSKLLQAVLGVILAGAPLFAATTVIKSAVNDKNVSAGYSKDSIELNRIVDVILLKLILLERKQIKMIKVKKQQKMLQRQVKKSCIKEL